MDVEELLAAKDFRLDKLAGKPLYFTPADASAKAEMDRLWGELTGNHPGAPADLEVKGRKLRVPLASMGVARFAFAELCEAPLGANDYLHIAHAFHTVLIDAIPVLTRPRATWPAASSISSTRSTTARVVRSSPRRRPSRRASMPAGDMGYLFDRTASRLIEMRSQSYLAARMDRLGAPVPA